MTAEERQREQDEFRWLDDAMVRQGYMGLDNQPARV